MASSYSASFRLNYQAPGDNLNLWGVVLNTAVFQLLEDATAGNASFTLSGTKTLTVNNGATDEARCMVLNVTGGTGGTITAPAVKKVYLVRNGSTGDVIVTAGGTSATVKAGQTQWVWSDGTNFRIVQSASWVGTGTSVATFSGYTSIDVGNAKIVNLGTPTDNFDASTKKYVDDTAFAVSAGSLPGLTGNAGRPLVVNTGETAPQWSLGWIAKSSNFTADRGGWYAVSTVSGAVTATLPASPQNGDEVRFVDAGYLSGTAGFGTNALTIARNGNTIMSLAENMTCDGRGQSFGLTYQSGDWRVIP